jgi:hypothetical protein
MDGGTISGNEATGGGGGVYVAGTGGASFIMSGNASVSNNKATNSVAGVGGGVMVVDGGSFTMNGGTIGANSAAGEDGGGGVLVGATSTFTMTDGTISGNSATLASASYSTGVVGGGGVSVATGGTFTKTGGTIYGDNTSSIDKNTAASGIGHAVYVENPGKSRNSTAGSDDDLSSDPTTFSLDDWDATSSYIQYEIGKISLGGTGTIVLPAGTYDLYNLVVDIDRTITITTKPNEVVILERNSSFTGDMIKVVYSSAYGGSLILQADTGGSLTLDGGNVSDVTGSLVKVESGGNLTMNAGVTLWNNKTSADGGGVYFAGTTFTMNGGTIGGNSATGNGGGVYVESGTFQKTGGVIYGDDASLSADKNTAASGNGHAVYVSAGPKKRNLTAGTGDALDSAKVALLGGWEFVPSSSAISEAITTAITSGGIIVLPAGTYDMTGAMADVTANITITTKPGAAVILKRNTGFTDDMIKVASGSLTLQAGTDGSLTLDGNDVPGVTGSLVNVDGGNLTMNPNVTLQKNKTSGAGGGVVVSYTSGNFTMNGGIISGNTSTFIGGGVEFSGTTFEMRGGTISGNGVTGASSQGGGVYLGANGIFYMSGGTISDNTAPIGGGVYMNNEGSAAFLMGAEANVLNNKATAGNGGGVYVNAGDFTMDGGTISDNEATGNGGGVFYDGSIKTFTMNGGIISKNKAYRGAGVYVESGTFKKVDLGASGYSGIIFGTAGEDPNNATSNEGLAVYVFGTPPKVRNLTAHTAVNLDSTQSGAGGGWEE